VGKIIGDDDAGALVVDGTDGATGPMGAADAGEPDDKGMGGLDVGARAAGDDDAGALVADGTTGDDVPALTLGETNGAAVTGPAEDDGAVGLTAVGVGADGRR
jgi:hypothetical protein